jgi:quercetin 2,3-dioxygenase
MGSKLRKIERIIEPQTVMEGAGVKVRRSIATRELNYLDPFLLWDHFGATDRQDYEAGFPMHPHRGIETVTYMLTGAVHHRDTLGNSGSIGVGDVQWMTSGRGILHEEMPQVRPEGIDGFQLWVNLPAKSKMTKPRYQDVNSGTIAETELEDGAKVRIVAGTINGVVGPVKEIAADPTYIDVAVPAHASATIPVTPGHNAFAYVFEGMARFEFGNQNESTDVAGPRLVVFGDGDSIRVLTGDSPVRFMLAAGKPLHEPVARYGPFVMNTKEEIAQALEDLRDGTFVTS